MEGSGREKMEGQKTQKTHKNPKNARDSQNNATRWITPPLEHSHKSLGQASHPGERFK
jgi:hypothetical protein